ncbi:hypothetical protein ABLE91_04970 [Aquabacter sp. CN5-332]|uniref:hypothetical protein n=1 Tax=Aquabacter sp. CN5-332 TaxID=3156608 RepID=UPI0032B44BBC
MPMVKIASNSTILNLTGKPEQREEYVRALILNFYKLGPNRAGFVVRIGAQGKGHSPHYRFETAVPVMHGDQPAGFSQDTFIIYNGLNHEEMTAFEIQDTNDQNWSSKTMTFAEVESHFGDLRARPRRI